MEEYNCRFEIKEHNTLELINAIVKSRRKKENFFLKNLHKFIIFSLIVVVVVFIFNTLHIKITMLYEFLRDMLTILSILIGFTITALTTIGTGLSDKALKVMFKYKSCAYEELPVYQATIFTFFEYTYSLFASLVFIIITMFFYPYIYYLHNYRILISIIFFSILLGLLWWNGISIKNLVYNLYVTIMLNAQIESEDD